MLDIDVQVFGGVRIQRRCQNAAVAERARAELHAALHPGDDLFVVQIADGAIEQFVRRQQIVEAQFAILQHLLDLLRPSSSGRGKDRSATRASSGRRRCSRRRTRRRARFRRCPPRAARTRCLDSSSELMSSAFIARPPATHRFSAGPAIRSTSVFDGVLQPGRERRSECFGNCRRRRRCQVASRTSR